MRAIFRYIIGYSPYILFGLAVLITLQGAWLAWQLADEQERSRVESVKQ